MDDGSGQSTFFFLWFIFAMGGFVFFYVSGNAAAKRRWWPAFNIVTGAFFLYGTFSVFTPETSAVSWVLVPILMWANIRNTRFCDNCGHTAAMHWVFLRPDFCPRCGEPL